MKSRCRQALAFSENRRSAAIFCFICDKKGSSTACGRRGMCGTRGEGQKGRTTYGFPSVSFSTVFSARYRTAAQVGCSAQGAAQGEQTVCAAESYL